MKKITRKMIDQYWPCFHGVVTFDTVWPNGMEITLESLRCALAFIPVCQWCELVHRAATGSILTHYINTRDLIDSMTRHDALVYWQREAMYLQLIKECLREIVSSEVSRQEKYVNRGS